MPVIRKGAAPRETEDERHLARGYGPYIADLLSDAGGLTQFGAFIETLPPGSRSGAAHWHEQEDEFILILSGTATLIEGASVNTVTCGDAACFPAGRPEAHFIENRSNADTSYLVVGTRSPHDVANLPDDDLILNRDANGTRWTDGAGQPKTRD